MDNCPKCGASLENVGGCRCPFNDKVCPQCGSHTVILTKGSVSHRVALAENINPHTVSGRKHLNDLNAWMWLDK